MDNLLSPQFLGPALVALITAAGSYFIIIQKTRNELADQTKRALDAFREKAEVAEANERLAFRAEQRVEMQELRQKIQPMRDRQGRHDRKAGRSAGQDHHLGSTGGLT